MLEHVYSHVVLLLCVPLIKADIGVLIAQSFGWVTVLKLPLVVQCLPLCSVLYYASSSPLTIQFQISGKQRKIAKYYKKQENLLKDFSEMETMNEHGGLDQNGPSEVRVHSTDFLQCSMQKST